MLVYAEVAVDSMVSTMENCVFDYAVPDKFLERVKRGIKVIVPFGRGRFVEGYVINVKKHSDVPLEKIKPVYDVPDEHVFLNDKQICLGEWMSKEYMCSMADILKCIVPSGVSARAEKMVILNETATPSDELEIKIKRTIKDSGGQMALSGLKKAFSYDISKALSKMQKKGAVSYKTSIKSGASSKIIKKYVLSVEPRQVEGVVQTMKGSRLEGQVKVLRLLADTGLCLTEKELVENYGCSSSSLKSLFKKGLLDLVEEKVNRAYYGNKVFQRTHKPQLTVEQSKVIDQIIKGYEVGIKNFLLFGVTGSGKTEVYMNIIEHMIKMGKQAIMLVPEIALTPQTIERFKGRFNRTAVIHSKLSTGERYDEWRRIENNEVDVVIGARSAVFAPLPKLGAIIIDEEHEGSYKSDKTPKYHTREVAAKRCEIENGILVLGSATPAIETYHHALQGKYTICSIKNRVDDRKLPEFKLVDMRDEIKKGNKTMFSRALYTGIREALDKKQQIILFLNRRGFSTFVSCRECGFVMKCLRCDVSLTYHNDTNHLNCHYCGYTISSPKICPKCGSEYIKYFGVGTQKVESEIKRYFPEARVLRMDVDTTSKRGSHDIIYNSFKNREADILVGTQMVSKGLDFPGVTLVGIIAADQSLNLPDYRSGERTFQLITQVSGRAGRGDEEGKVVVQTYSPEHYSIKSALSYDYEGFFQNEIQIRKSFLYPPFSDLISIVSSSKDEKETIESIQKITESIKTSTSSSSNIFLLGPSPAPLSKINSYYRWQLVIKGQLDDSIKYIVKNIVNNEALYNNNIRVSMDVNPVSLL